MKRALLPLLMACMWPLSASADSWAYPEKDKVFLSEDGQFRFTVLIPAREKIPLPLHTLPSRSSTNASAIPRRGKDCVGVLEEISEGKTRTVWRKKLVNPVSPLDGMITDDGAFVVTFDNWFGVGEDPIVIYDRKGRLVRRHTLETLGLLQFTWEGTGLEKPKIHNSVSSTYWKEDGLTFFSGDQTKLIVLLHWGYLFGVKLDDGSLLEDKELAADSTFIDAHVRREVARLLESEEGWDRRQGARLSSSRKLVEFIPRLRDLLTDATANIGYTRRDGEYFESFREYYVRRAAFESLSMLGERPGPVVVREDFDDAPDRAKVEVLGR